jgi:heme-degrading monooxygenase HmoA
LLKIALRKWKAKLLFARMSVWTFKKGQREKGLDILNERISSQARSTKGYRGYMQLLSEEAADCATIITLWESDDTRNSSSKDVFKDAIKVLEQQVECPPVVTNFKMSDAELRV